MISLHQQFVKSFLAGEKHIELRTRVPKELRQGDTVLVAQSGSHNQVVMQMTVESVIELSPEEMFREHYKSIRLDYPAYDAYTQGRKLVYGIRMIDVTKIGGVRHTYDYGIARAPQWFRKVK